MARIRTIKPTHWADKELPKIPLQAHLLWIATWNFSDDSGVFDADPLLIRSQVFPRRTDIRVEQIQLWIGQLVKARFILPFTFNGEGYYVHRTFGTHQRIDKPQPSHIPEDVLSSVFVEYSTNVLGTIPPVEYSNSNSKGGEGSVPPPAPELSQEEIKFHSFNGWLQNNAPQVLKMKEQVTPEQFRKLTEAWALSPHLKQQHLDLILAMHNYKPLLTKNNSAYLTLLKWAEKDNKKTSDADR